MQRHPHVISARNGDYIPGRFIILAARFERSPLTAGGAVSRLQVAEAWLTQVRAPALPSQRTTDRHVYGAGEVWDAIAAWSPASTSPVIVARRALETWTALGLWEQIQAGR